MDQRYTQGVETYIKNKNTWGKDTYRMGTYMETGNTERGDLHRIEIYTEKKYKTYIKKEHI